MAEKRRAPRQAVFHPEFLADLRHWVQHEPRTARRLVDLVNETLRDPYQGIGKPEHLKYLGPDVWSRRITQEHRCVYVVKDDRVEFVQGRYHYA